MTRWYVHACRLDRDCRSVNAPNRVHVTTPWVTVAVAFERDARFLVTKAVRDDDGRWHMPPRPWKFTWLIVTRRRCDSAP